MTPESDEDGGTSVRRQQLERAVRRGVAEWRQRRADPPPEPDDNLELLRPLPRRKPMQPQTAGNVPPPSMRKPVRLQASWWATCRRLLVWLRLALFFFFATAWNVVLRRDTPERRARRLRRMLENVGGSFLKLGQQMSIRIDVLPMVYCNELSKLLDRVPPFDTEKAMEAIERATGKSLGETFAAFDPEPIGSASVACVFQAQLLSGERVAVKVRRPGIVQTFGADRRALSWIIGLLELLSIVRPEQLRGMLDGLTAMFTAELDFHLEARNTDLFRRRATRSRLQFLTAPQVFFEYSNAEVLVTEFVSGIWLWELLGAVETGDREALAEIERLDIEPRAVARRLFEASLFGIFENIIFHADPHPANVVIRPGGEIVLIDFGSCGSFSERQLRIMRHFHYCRARDDAGGMMQCALALVGPLPPIDVDTLQRDAEEIFADSIQAVESSGSEWWERTSAGVWIGFLHLVRSYQMQVHIDVLRMVRSTLLYDTVALRLDPQLNIYAEYSRYRKRMAQEASRRFRQRIRDTLRHGPDNGLFLRLEELADMGQRLTYRLGHFADVPTYSFRLLAGKAVYALTSLLDWGLLAVGVAAAGTVALSLPSLASGQAPPISETALQVISSPYYASALGLALLIQIRRILVRFRDREIGRSV